MMWDTDEPRHCLRWTRDHRIVFGGADQAPPSPRRRDAVLVQRTGQLMYELSTLYPSISGLQPDYAWDAEVVATTDGLPLIGPHRHFPRHLFALGAGVNGLATFSRPVSCCAGIGARRRPAPSCSDSGGSE